MSTSGLYIVTLNNEESIGVNANDPRYAATCLRVNRDNCKFGKAHNFDARRKNYEKTFKKENVNFFPIVAVADCGTAEKIVLAQLRTWRVRHVNGRIHEWLVGISPHDLEQLIIATLNNAGLPYQQIGSVR
jgi:hypothetical protein